MHFHKKKKYKCKNIIYYYYYFLKMQKIILKFNQNNKKKDLGVKQKTQYCLIGQNKMVQENGKCVLNQQKVEMVNNVEKDGLIALIHI
ncbi:hypothetical protein IMG5_144180 [Ichthyophthirius multifiliis]|uniref:Uncharacterized protein n=1 Tax=Ichthyophthirius multifiliis TaxID=5932 RepID=G0QXN4_ICHMU|nr:hypothetical protein IMG5_144180 [Ichthyophthirius multifiliis]EGR30015.1 hypothetical protein IMG5_144180 [Ichthyophthirius multifiliis]|eukprot:XP_004031251.1 hypothetical protein IMG5_144180 [Ichthyophthirius multifiliis]